MLFKQDKVDDAIEEFRAALRIRPDHVDARANLGSGLASKGLADEAIAELREALRLKPEGVDIHYNLGNALATQGKVDEAIAEYREALRLQPNRFDIHYNLGEALGKQGKLEEAITEYRETLRLKPECAEAHCNLGQIILAQHRPIEGLAELKRGHELGSRNPSWRYPSAQWVREAERLVGLDRKLPGFLGGHDKPADASDSFALAQICYGKKLHGASARFWAGAFLAQPSLADDMVAQNRYNAACAASLAGSGEGKDEPPLDDAKKTHWRNQALDWLNADLAAWSKILSTGPPQAKQVISQTLQHWKADTDLAGLRDAAALAKLPGEEQKACRALWVEVDALLAKAQNSHPKSGR